MKEIIMNKKSYISFVVLNILFVLFIYMTTFYVINELSSLYRRVRDMDNNYVYVSNVNIDSFYSIGDLNNAYKYDISYTEDGKTILYMNSNASKYGIIYPYNGGGFCKIDLSNLEKDKIYSSFKGDENYYNFNNLKNLKSRFIKFNYHYDYLIISDDYFIENEYSMIIMNYVSNELREKTGFNEVFDEGFIMTGNKFKEDYDGSLKDTKLIIIIISILPCLFSIFSICNLLNFFFDKEKYNFKIKMIFYSSKVKLLLKYFILFSLIICITNLISIGISNLFFSVENNLWQLSYFIITSIEIISCFIIFTYKIRKISKKLKLGEDL